MSATKISRFPRFGSRAERSTELSAFDSIVRRTRAQLRRLVIRCLDHGLPADQVEAALHRATDGLARLGDDLKS